MKWTCSPGYGLGPSDSASPHYAQVSYCLSPLPSGDRCLTSLPSGRALRTNIFSSPRYLTSAPGGTRCRLDRCRHGRQYSRLIRSFAAALSHKSQLY